jgi:hypothetical protein
MTGVIQFCSVRTLPVAYDSHLGLQGGVALIFSTFIEPAMIEGEMMSTQVGLE